jgi:hypothetical protein
MVHGLHPGFGIEWGQVHCALLVHAAVSVTSVLRHLACCLQKRWGLSFLFSIFSGQARLNWVRVLQATAAGISSMLVAMPVGQLTLDCLQIRHAANNE